MLEKDYPYTILNSKEAQYINTSDRCTRCPVCNKVFLIRFADDYVYKFRNKKGTMRFFCGYNCKRNAEKKILENHVDGRRRYINYPDDYPDNWITNYNRFIDRAITKAEAARVMDISIREFDTLRDYYENLSPDER